MSKKLIIWKFKLNHESVEHEADRPDSPACGLDDGLNVLEGPLGLRGYAALHEVAGGGVEAELAGHEEQPALGGGDHRHALHVHAKNAPLFNDREIY